MKIIFTLILFITISFSCFSQTIYKISFNRTADIDSITLKMPNKLNINLSKYGEILNLDVDSDDIYEYYSSFNDAAIVGKLKRIGNVEFKYCTVFDGPDVGKLKSIGILSIEYYNLFDDENLLGRIKRLGQTKFNYYDKFDEQMNQGKIKKIGNTTFGFFGIFDDSSFQGKLKSIGDKKYTYYSSFDDVAFRGKLKSGYRSLTFDGIKYTIGIDL